MQKTARLTVTYAIASCFFNGCTIKLGLTSYMALAHLMLCHAPTYAYPVLLANNHNVTSLL